MEHMNMDMDMDMDMGLLPLTHRNASFVTHGVAAHLELQQLASEPRALGRGRERLFLEGLLLHSLACEQRVQPIVLLCHATLLRLHLGICYRM